MPVAGVCLVADAGGSRTGMTSPQDGGAGVEPRRRAGVSDVSRGADTVRVAASSQWIDHDGTRQPEGDVHAWMPRTNQTLCGLSLRRSALSSFQHVPWADALWLAETGDHRLRLCPKCDAAVNPARNRRGWARPHPRP
jgi:hypothetical protein